MLSPSAYAWEFTPGAPCKLSHSGPDATVELTYDPTLPLYTIAIMPKKPFEPAPVFAVIFEGPRGLTISTNRHQLSDGGRKLTVNDTGFGNVLNGLQFNRTATAELGQRRLSFPLDNAAPAVAAFRECAPPVS
ncbi:MAG: hypothetical protein HKN30_12435 [Sulfitobacter sp.]|nr:hypothetical protein [Sulfitobacter sp.]